MDALGPQGRLEEELADRIALQLWRLRRVARYERETLALLQGDADTRVHRPRPARPREAVDLEIAQAELRDARATARLTNALPSLAQDAVVSGVDLARLAFVFEQAAGEGAEVEALPDPDGGELIYLDELVEGKRRWPIRMLRDALPGLAGTISLEQLQRRAKALAWDWRTKAFEKHHGARKAYEERRRADEGDRLRAEEARRKHILPVEHEREQLSRYETTLERSVFRTLAELRLLQAGRAGEPTVVVVRGDESAGSSGS